MGTATVKSPRTGTRGVFFFLALVCFGTSILVHWLFLQKAGAWVMTGFSPESYDTIVPRTFRMKRVEIDPRILEEQTPLKQEVPQKIPVTIDPEAPRSDQTAMVMGESKILMKPEERLPAENPDAKIPSKGLERMLTEEVRQTDTGTTAGSPMTSEDFLKLPGTQTNENDKLDGKTGAEEKARQFSSLDDLLASAGTVTKNTAPILMPTDLLFEYDSDALKPEAAATLAKLGTLIKKNARAFFRIEGYTDSFGTDEYNVNLSLRRAEAVKNWLKSTMGLDASHISTVGLGKTKLLVPATGSVEQQQLNRRVEIVISLPK